MKKPPIKLSRLNGGPDYTGLVASIGVLLEAARRATVRVTNALMTATYWEVGRRIVEFEQGGKKRAGYGEELLVRLSVDLTERHGRGFSRFNLARFRSFYLAFPFGKIRATPSLKSAGSPGSGGGNKRATLSLESMQHLPLSEISRSFPLPWSHYALLIRGARTPEALDFYHTEALRGGWSVRQLDRQINSLFYERTALSQKKSAMLKKGAKPTPGEALTADDAIRDPLVLEFLNLRDEYSETDLEDALIRHLETFLLELGGDFAFVGRHRRLRCLIIIDLKLGRFAHADAGQMHLYVNYARAHWMHAGENPPVGLILCSSAGRNLVRYTLENLPSKVLAREYRLALPNEKRLAKELQKARNRIESLSTSNPG